MLLAAFRACRIKKNTLEAEEGLPASSKEPKVMFINGDASLEIVHTQP